MATVVRRYSAPGRCEKASAAGALCRRHGSAAGVRTIKDAQQMVSLRNPWRLSPGEISALSGGGWAVPGKAAPRRRRCAV